MMDKFLLGELKEDLNERLKTWRWTLNTHYFRLGRSKTRYTECKFSKRRNVSNLKVKVRDHTIQQVT